MYWKIVAEKLAESLLTDCFGDQKVLEKVLEVIGQEKGKDSVFMKYLREMGMMDEEGNLDWKQLSFFVPNIFEEERAK